MSTNYRFYLNVYTGSREDNEPVWEYYAENLSDEYAADILTALESRFKRDYPGYDDFWFRAEPANTNFGTFTAIVDDYAATLRDNDMFGDPEEDIE
jgi:hypothetical protein